MRSASLAPKGSEVPTGSAPGCFRMGRSGPDPAAGLRSRQGAFQGHDGGRPWAMRFLLTLSLLLAPLPLSAQGPRHSFPAATPPAAPISGSLPDSIRGARDDLSLAMGEIGRAH